MRKNKIWIATGNANKVREASEVLSSYGIKLEHYPVRRIEIQADDLADIASYSLQFVEASIPVCIEDAGLFINHLGGFPGPYSSYILRKLGNPGILKIMEGEVNRSAYYLSTIAYRNMGEVHIFRGVVEGEIAHSIRGTNGFGYDPIFIPAEGDGRTFGEMGECEKNKISHRARSFCALAEWMKKTRSVNPTFSKSI